MQNWVLKTYDPQWISSLLHPENIQADKLDEFAGVKASNVALLPRSSE
jgi:hypothetical protein